MTRWMFRMQQPWTLPRGLKLSFAPCYAIYQLVLCPPFPLWYFNTLYFIMFQCYMDTYAEINVIRDYFFFKENFGTNWWTYSRLTIFYDSNFYSSSKRIWFLFLSSPYSLFQFKACQKAWFWFQFQHHDIVIPILSPANHTLILILIPIPIPESFTTLFEKVVRQTGLNN